MVPSCTWCAQDRQGTQQAGDSGAAQGRGLLNIQESMPSNPMLLRNPAVQWRGQWNSSVIPCSSGQPFGGGCRSYKPVTWQQPAGDSMPMCYHLGPGNAVTSQRPLADTQQACPAFQCAALSVAGPAMWYAVCGCLLGSAFLNASSVLSSVHRSHLARQRSWFTSVPIAEPPNGCCLLNCMQAAMGAAAGAGAGADGSMESLMAQLHSSPVMDQLLSNPELLRSMMTSNPMIQQVGRQAGMSRQSTSHAPWHCRPFEVHMASVMEPHASWC
jgi:hypothetical protein